MALHMQKILKLIRKDVEKNWDALTFDYKDYGEYVTADTALRLKNHDDDVRVVICVYAEGGAHFRAVFDRIVPDLSALSLLNAFNNKDPFFKAYIREDGYLELRHFFVCYEEEMFRQYAGEFLMRLSEHAADPELMALTRATK